MLVTHAAWVLLVTFSISLAYEVYRATVKAGTSRHDSTRALGLQLPMYAIAAAIVWGLFVAASWASWAGLAFSFVMILTSILYYNPVILVEREPRMIDWIEDLLFTGLLFVAATQLLYDVTGRSLQQ